MERRLAEEIRASLRGREVVHRYYRDRYALQILTYAAPGRRPSQLRRGRLRPLLEKPEVRRVLGKLGGRGIDWSLLDSYFPARTEEYGISLGIWGGEGDASWYQMSRPGYGVVVQLNFPRKHERAYRRYVDPDGVDPFVAESHPVRLDGSHTLAWARVDLDLRWGEALIEEIQNDWIRYAGWAADSALRSLVDGEVYPRWNLDGARGDARQVLRYYEHVLESHRRLWEEAVLSATLWLLREHLAIHRIYMHTFDGGCRLKRMEDWKPPRSLYEEMPRSFCFRRVRSGPRFLPAKPGAEFWYLRV